MKTLDSSVLTNCGPRSGMRFSKNNRSIAGLQGFSGGFPELFTITQAMTPSANNAQLRGNPSKSPYICILFDSPQMIKLNDPCIINSIPPPKKRKVPPKKNLKSGKFRYIDGLNCPFRWPFYQSFAQTPYMMRAIRVASGVKSWDIPGGMFNRKKPNWKVSTPSKTSRCRCQPQRGSYGQRKPSFLGVGETQGRSGWDWNDTNRWWWFKKSPEENHRLDV